MCFNMGGGGGGTTYVTQQPATPPVKTSFDIQQEAEAERLRLNASTYGWASTVIAGKPTTTPTAPGVSFAM